MAGQVLDMHARSSVHLRGVLLGEQGDTAHTTTFSPLPMTTMPRAEMVKWLASSSGSVPTRTPGATTTFLSMMARRTTAPSPMRTLSMITESSTSAPWSTFTPGEMTERLTVPPEMIEPADTMESNAWPDSPGVLEDELGRRQLGRAREDGPVGVVQVEGRLHGDQVHAGVVVAVERADVTPVTPFDPCAPADVVGVEIVEMGVAALDETRDDIAAHVVAAVGVLGVLSQRVHQGGGIEDVIAHRGVKVRPPRGQRHGVRRLFDETVDDASLGRVRLSRSRAPRRRAPLMAATVAAAPLSMCWRSIWLGSIR